MLALRPLPLLLAFSSTLAAPAPAPVPDAALRTASGQIEIRTRRPDLFRLEWRAPDGPWETAWLPAGPVEGGPRLRPSWHDDELVAIRQDCGDGCWREILLPRDGGPERVVERPLARSAAARLLASWDGSATVEVLDLDKGLSVPLALDPAPSVDEGATPQADFMGLALVVRWRGEDGVGHVRSFALDALIPTGEPDSAELR